MKQSRISMLGMGFVVAIAGMLAVAADTQAQGIYIGPGGISFGSRVGSYNLPLNNGGTLYNRDGFFGMGRSAGRSGLYWAPGMLWSPSNYWYGDVGWPRFINMFSGYGSGLASGGNSNGQYVDFSSIPPLPEHEELQRMKWTHLRRILSFATLQMEEGLSRVDTGSKWFSYLQLERLHSISANHVNLPPTREEAAELQDILKKFDKIAGDEQYSAITGLWGFEAIERTLTEFLVNPATRYRLQLVLNSKDLDQSLERFNTGPTWLHYLTLPTDLYTIPEDVSAENSPPEPEALRAALAKYDDVAKNPAYRMIAELPAFQETHDSLARYLGRGDVGRRHRGRLQQDVCSSYRHFNGAVWLWVWDSTNGSYATWSKQDDATKNPSDNPDGDSQPDSSDNPKDPLKQAEELLPPALDSTPAKPGPAVREKE